MIMTIAAENGFEVGKSYHVKEGVNRNYYTAGMILKFTWDDGSDMPLFKILEGKAKYETDDKKIYVYISDLSPISIDNTNTSDESKSVLMSLQTYIKHQYPNDVVLNTLVNTIWLINKGECK